MALGKTIEQLRRQRGLTRQQLAEKVDVHHSMVSRWEKGVAQPRAKTLDRLAEFFDLTVEQLLAGDYVGVTSTLREAQDPELIQMFGQIHKLTGTEQQALKTVLGAMLARAQMAEVVANRAG